MSHCLNAADLLQLEAALIGARAPIAHRWNPPASSEALARVEASLGHDLPDELRLWWSWHDGAGAPEDLFVSRSIGPTWMCPCSILNSLETTARIRGLQVEIWGDQAEERFPSTLLVLMAGNAGTGVLGDLIPGQDETLPLRYWDPHSGEPVAAVSSLGTAVRWWIEALQAGAWSYDVRAGVWRLDESRLAHERRVHGITV